VVTMVWVVSTFRLKASLVFHLPIYYHTHNVTAPHGRPNVRSRLQFRHNQEGRPRSSVEHVVVLGGVYSFVFNIWLTGPIIRHDNK
jgi:hypothetical protein